MGTDGAVESVNRGSADGKCKWTEVNIRGGSSSMITTRQAEICICAPCVKVGMKTIQ